MLSELLSSIISPLSDLNLCRFVSFLFNRDFALSSILSSLRFFQMYSGGQDPGLAQFPRLHYVIRAVSQISPAASRPSRLPITPDVLQLLHSVWSVPPLTFNHRMLWVACCLGFFAFLRSGEFTCPSDDRIQSAVLSVGDVCVNSHVHPKYLVIRLRQSKTDVFGRGLSLYVGATGCSLCPVAAVLSYLAARPSSPGPLFVFQDGRPLSRPKLVAAVRQALRLSGGTHHDIVAIAFELGLLPLPPRLAYRTPLFRP